MGNLLSQAEMDGSVTTFSYDKSYQLVNETRSGFHPYNITYSYDALGNRLVQTSGSQLTTFSCNQANELVLAVQPAGQYVTTTYGANGYTLLDAGSTLTTYSWDSNNRLLSYHGQNAVVTSTYSLVQTAGTASRDTWCCIIFFA